MQSSFRVTHGGGGHGELEAWVQSCVSVPAHKEKMAGVS